MSGSHYLSKSTVSRSCFNCRQGHEHYCKKCLGWLRSVLQEPWTARVTGRRTYLWWTWRYEPSYRRAARPLYLQGITCPTWHEGSWVLSQSRTESITCVFNPFFSLFVWVFFGGVGELFACLFVFVAHLMITYLGNGARLQKCLQRFYWPSWHR